MPTPLKIVRIIARLNVGGPAKHVAWLTAGLREPEYQSLLVAGTVPDGEGDMSYFADGLGVTPIYIPEMSREISLKDFVTIWKLYRLFMRERPDVVHTHTAKAGTVGRVAGFLYRWATLRVLLGQPRECRFVHTYHGHIFHSYYSPALTKAFILIEKILAKLVTDRIVVISQQQGHEISETFGVGSSDQFRIIPLGLDLSAFDNHSSRRQQFRTELGIDEKTVLVGIVGRLTEIKNHELFLKSVAQLKTIDPTAAERARFVIIGDGGLRRTLEEQSRALKLDENVIFAGSRTDPENFYPALDAVALTSRNEGTPLTLIEAMANARAVVATSVGGVVDLLGEVESDGQVQVCERGLRVKPGDEVAFATALSKIIGNRELREAMGSRGHEFVQKMYPKERLLNDIRSLYAELSRVESPVVESRSSRHGVHSSI
jgi:glycosyltransferase involved in cell wall biosynthesis